MDQSLENKDLFECQIMAHIEEFYYYDEQFKLWTLCLLVLYINHIRFGLIISGYCAILFRIQGAELCRVLIAHTL